MKKTNYIFYILAVTVLWTFSCTRPGKGQREKPIGALTPKKQALPDEVAPEILKVQGYAGYYAPATVSEDAAEDVPYEEVISELNKKEGKMRGALINFGIGFIDSEVLPSRVHRQMPVIFQIDFDNDIFDETDYYYTNGVRLSLTTPLAQDNFLYKILVRPQYSSIFFTGFSLRQNMYTPTDPDVPLILKGDHPFAGYMVFGQFNRSVDFKRKINLFSEITMGVIGPASLAGSVQYALHEKKPEGWVNQIRNDIILNYQLSVEKSLLGTPHAEFNVFFSGRAGTLYDDVAAGISLRLGRFVSVYRGIYPYRKLSGEVSPFQYWFFAKADTKGVLYNATLQGGMFRSSPYTIASADVNRVLVTASAGIALYYGSIGLELENFYQTPRFKGAYHFKWGRIKVAVMF